MRQDLPLVSVIIPFYNEERFLPEAIESVLAQTYARWELILVDDGSVNRSTQIARSYAAAHPHKIYYIEHPNHGNIGAAASRNVGILASNGELLAFLDADDKWLPKKLEEQVAIYLKYPEIGLLVEASIYWNSWSDKDRPDVQVNVGTQQNKLYAPFELAQQLYPLGKGHAPSPCSWLLTRAAFDRSGGFEPVFRGAYQLYEDQAFLAKIYLQEQVYVSGNANNYYRQRIDSCVASVNGDGKYHTVRQYFLNWLNPYLQVKDIDHPGIRKLLNQALKPYRYPRRHYLSTRLWTDVYGIAKKIVPEPIKKVLR